MPGAIFTIILYFEHYCLFTFSFRTLSYTMVLSRLSYRIYTIVHYCTLSYTIVNYLTLSYTIVNYLTLSYTILHFTHFTLWYSIGKMAVMVLIRIYRNSSSLEFQWIPVCVSTFFKAFWTSLMMSFFLRGHKKKAA